MDYDDYRYAKDDLFYLYNDFVRYGFEDLDKAFDELDDKMHVFNAEDYDTKAEAEYAYEMYVEDLNDAYHEYLEKLEELYENIKRLREQPYRQMMAVLGKESLDILNNWTEPE